MRESPEPVQPVERTSEGEGGGGEGSRSRLRQRLQAIKGEHGSDGQEPLSKDRSGASVEATDAGVAESADSERADGRQQAKGVRDAVQRLRGWAERAGTRSGPETTHPAVEERPAWRGDVEEGGEALTEMPEVLQQLRETVERAREAVDRWGQEDRARAETWFGSSSAEVRQRLGEVLRRMQPEIERVRLLPFEADQDPKEMAETFAYVYPGDRERRVYVGELFRDSTDRPPDSRAGILVHELSHFRDVGGTRDVMGAYGTEGSRSLAVKDPEVAQRTADNLQYFVEEYSPKEDER